jgi:hypothetical protein
MVADASDDPAMLKRRRVIITGLVMVCLAAGVVTALSGGGSSSPSQQANLLGVCFRHPQRCQTTTAQTTTPATTVTTTTVATTTPLPTGLSGLGLISYGSFPLATDPNKDRYTVVSAGGVDRANTPLTGLGLLYRNAMAVPSGYDGGIDYTTALNNDWLLKDTSGAYLTYDGDRILDPGNTALQDYYISHVQALLTQYPGIEGIWFDNIIDRLDWATGGKWAAQYPDQTSYGNAMIAFITKVGGYFKSHGYYVATNSLGKATAQYIDHATVWGQRVAPYTNAQMSEHWIESSSGTDWATRQSIEAKVQSWGNDFQGLDITASPTDLRALYGRASFLLDWNGGRGGYFSWINNTTDPWDLSWAVDVGTPSAPKIALANGMFTREYAKAKVYVNPTSSSQTADGLTFASATARIILK